MTPPLAWKKEVRLDRPLLREEDAWAYQAATLAMQWPQALGFPALALSVLAWHLCCSL